MKVTNLSQKLGWLAGLAALAGPAMLPTSTGVTAGRAIAQQPQAPATVPSSMTAQQQYEQLLGYARAAMRANDFPAAERFIADAEKLGYQPSGLVARLADTPARARQDLESMRQGRAPTVTPESASRDLAQAEAAVRRAREALGGGNVPAAINAFAEAAAKGGQNPAVGGQLQQLQRDLANAGVQANSLAQAVQNYRPLPAAPAVGQGSLPNIPSLAPGLPAQAGMVVPAGGQMPVGPGAQAGAVQPGVFNPQQDRSQVVQVAAQGQAGVQPDASGESLYEAGLQALTSGNRELALQRFSEAWKYEAKMDPAIRQQLREKLMLLNVPQARNEDQLPAGGDVELGAANEAQAALRQKMFREVTGEIAESERTRESDPLGAVQRLTALRLRISQSELDNATKKQFLTMADRAISAQQAYVDQNRANIEQDERNRQILAEMDLDRQRRAKLDEEIASLVEQFNGLMEQRRYEEAEVIAKQVMELDPGSQIAVALYQNSKLARRIREQSDIRNIREERYTDLMNATEASAVAPNDEMPLTFPDAEKWDQIRNMRRGQADSIVNMSEAERAIYNKLSTPVSVQFSGRPLSEAMEVLSQMVGIPIVIDPAGLAAEGLQSDRQVTLNLNTPISLKSALTLLLEPIGLGHTVKNDVLMITNRDQIKRNVETQTYNVKDLVIPIPNFINDYNQGMAGALNAAINAQSNRLLVQASQSTPLQLASSQAGVNPNSPVLAQLNGLPGMGGPGMGMPGLGMPGMGGPMVNGAGPGMGASPGMGAPMGNGMTGGLGGASAADFSQLMLLIQSTIDPDLWEAGDATMQPYPGNLSLVISAPQETHEEIADLLEALRALQNVQVTIEVRFITLGDNFFERIGVDFDFKIDDNVTQPLSDDQGSTVTVGLDATGAPTADLDLTFNQGSFAATQPQIGGFNAQEAASFGFAILSDIEMFFFLEAAQGDSRTNVLQAPKVTLYDGQFASINDTTSRPFVTSLIPVVGAFAVAQQPVIVVLSEGTQLNVQAVVSPDKRFVRLTLLPNFTTIGEVNTFTFEGRRTSNSGSIVRDEDDVPTDDRDNEEEVIEGTTVQQPSFSNTSVFTSVNVPDGGTILLGGIKRLRENRIERGVPMLSKIPYINRLFKNVGIGRETSTFMMTVTPRIIIREEEEERQAGVPAP